MFSRAAALADQTRMTILPNGPRPRWVQRVWQICEAILRIAHGLQAQVVDRVHEIAVGAFSVRRAHQFLLGAISHACDLVNGFDRERFDHGTDSLELHRDGSPR
jgi:hypothetical protein